MPITETNWTRLIGKHLRKESEDVTRDELPRRWIDLILFLDEQERERDRNARRSWESPDARRKH